MLNSFFETFFFLKYPLLCLFIAFTFLSLFWTKIFHALNLKTYQDIQRVHKNEVSRLGGLFIYIFIASLMWLELIQQKFILNILIAAIPFISIALKEDIFHNTTPKLRLITMVMSCLIFFYLNPINFPVIDFPYLGYLISLYPVGIIFFTFSSLVVMNGMNMIDGMNGLFGITAILQLLSISSIGFFYEDSEIIFLSMIFMAPLIIFLGFNFPFGKVFIGDTGAYFYGFVIALLTIYTFGKNNQLLSWLAILILFYPCMEILFSFIRKIAGRLSPLAPDNQHLHTLIFGVLKKKSNKTNFSNVMTTFILFPLYAIPTFLVLFLFPKISLNVLIIILSSMSIGYIYFYKKLNNSE